MKSGSSSLIAIAYFLLSLALVSASASVTVAAAAPQSSTIWSVDFESGTHDRYFNYPSTTNTCPGNNPGTVSNFAHSGRYSGYYYVNGSHTADCRSYWTIEFGTCAKCKIPEPTTRDLFFEMWVYVPKTSMTDWISFATILFDDYKGITIDSDKSRAIGLYLNNGIFAGPTYVSQTNPIKWPFDSWFKIGAEIHYKPAPKTSTVILYQNDVPIIDFRGTALDSRPRNLWIMHFGLYMGPLQGNFAIYNDDIFIRDISSGLLVLRRP